MNEHLHSNSWPFVLNKCSKETMKLVKKLFIFGGGFNLISFNKYDDAMFSKLHSWFWPADDLEISAKTNKSKNTT